MNNTLSDYIYNEYTEIDPEAYCILTNREGDIMLYNTKFGEHSMNITKLSKFYEIEREVMKGIYFFYSGDIDNICKHLNNNISNNNIWTEIEDEILKNENSCYYKNLFDYKGKEEIYKRKKIIDDIN